MRAVVFAYHNVGDRCLRVLHARGVEVALVVTHRDRPDENIWFQRVVNYGAYNGTTYADVNVCAPTHPEHAELLNILRNPILKRPSINMHMLMALLPEVVASEERLEFLY